MSCPLSAFVIVGPFFTRSVIYRCSDEAAVTCFHVGDILLPGEVTGETLAHT